MKNKGLIILLAIAGSIGNTMAQTPSVMLNDKTGWHKIAGKNVDLELDRDEISVVGADRFAQVKVVVTAGALNLYDMEVYYDDGSKQVIEVRNPLKVGVDSRVYDLKSNEKDIKKVVLIYKTLANSKDKKAMVEIWGLKSNTNPNKAAIPSPAVMISDKTGWHKIGERNVDLVKDRDEISVIGADRFSSIKFMVTEASIDLNDLEVYYESGDKQNIQVRNPVMAGTESKVIDLNGGERSLKKIVFIYKTLPNQKSEKAHVEVWGLKTNTTN